MPAAGTTNTRPVTSGTFHCILPARSRPVLWNGVTRPPVGQFYRRDIAFDWRVAEAEGVALSQFINVAVAEKLSALRTEDYFRERARRGSVDQAKRLLKRAGRGNSCRRRRVDIALRPPRQGKDSIKQPAGVLARARGTVLNRIVFSAQPAFVRRTSGLPTILVYVGAQFHPARSR
jgi:hypothetical protein